MDFVCFRDFIWTTDLVLTVFILPRLDPDVFDELRASLDKVLHNYIEHIGDKARIFQFCCHYLYSATTVDVDVDPPIRSTSARNASASCCVLK